LAMINGARATLRGRLRSRLRQPPAHFAARIPEVRRGLRFCQTIKAARLAGLDVLGEVR